MGFIFKFSNLNCQICPEFKGWVLPEVLSKAPFGGPVRGRWLRADKSGWALNVTVCAH